jgi:hypothetical protein
VVVEWAPCADSQVLAHDSLAVAAHGYDGNQSGHVTSPYSIQRDEADDKAGGREEPSLAGGSRLAGW